jgi:hypothetical protein
MQLHRRFWKQRLWSQRLWLQLRRFGWALRVWTQRFGAQLHGLLSQCGGRGGAERGQGQFKWICRRTDSLNSKPPRSPVVAELAPPPPPKARARKGGGRYGYYYTTSVDRSQVGGGGQNMRALIHLPLDGAIARRRWPASVRTPRDVSNARAAARRRGPPAERTTVEESTSRERQGRANQTHTSWHVGLGQTDGDTDDAEGVLVEQSPLTLATCKKEGLQTSDPKPEGLWRSICAFSQTTTGAEACM